jgi:hypothetical protein
MRRQLLRVILILDAAALVLLGAAMIVVPDRTLALFGIVDAPGSVRFIIGSFGAVYITMGAGYVIAAQTPMRCISWIQIGIARATAECLFGVVAVIQGYVTFRQAGAAIVLPGLVAVAFVLLYPRPELPSADATEDAADPGTAG